MRNKNKAFTLIELLVVISIIAALVAILSVGQRKVKITSQNLRQKAAFHAGKISLELYSKDFGGYPDSGLVESGGTYVTGAQRLAEAFFGRDDRGFNPRTQWHPAEDPADLYSDELSSLKARKTPYFERKRVGFHSVFDLWQGAQGSILPIYQESDFSANINPDKTTVSPVFTDVFEQNRVTINGESEKVGMPVLYFKADSTKRFRVDRDRNPVNPATPTEYVNWVYNFNDNLPLLELPWLRDPTAQPDGLDLHYRDPTDPAKSHAQYFYELITERQDGNFYRPHNQSTFLLISAGYDGIFGTKDDLTNFDD